MKNVIEMRQLQYFMICAEMGSISKAAEILYTTQPNVSKVIRALESYLGAELFFRNGRGIALTTEGERVYQYAKIILQNAENLQNMVKKQDYDRFHVISMPSNYLAAVFAEYCRESQSGGIKYYFREGSAGEVISGVESRVYEAGFVYMQEKKMPSFQYFLDRKKLEYHEIRKGSLVVYVGEKNPFYHEKLITEKILRQLHFIKTDEDIWGIDADLIKVIKGQRNPMADALVTNSDHVSMQLLTHTDYAQISMLLADEVNPNTEIRGIPIENAGRVSFGYVTRKEAEMGKEMKRFLEVLVEKCCRQKEETADSLI